MADDEAEKKGSAGCGFAIMGAVAVALLAVVVIFFVDGSDPEGKSTELCQRAVRLRLQGQDRSSPAARFTDEEVTELGDRFLVTGSVEALGRSTFTCTVRRSGDTIRVIDLDVTAA